MRDRQTEVGGEGGGGGAISLSYGTPTAVSQ